MIGKNRLLTLLVALAVLSMALAGATGTVAANDSQYLTDEGEDDSTGGTAETAVGATTGAAGGACLPQLMLENANGNTC